MLGGGRPAVLATLGVGCSSSSTARSFLGAVGGTLLLWDLCGSLILCSRPSGALDWC